MKQIFFLATFFIQALLVGVAQERIFKEYDIRGIVGSEFTVEETYDMTTAILTVLKEKDANLKTLVVGADGRIHSPAIKQQMVQSLLDHGFDVIDIGTCTTPVLYFAMHTEASDAGLMITASHNPGEYNGIKICFGKSLLYGAQIKEIQTRYFAQNWIEKSDQIGNIQKIDMIERYITFLSDAFSHLQGISLSAIVDCGNGAAGTVMPRLVKKMDWKNIELLYPEVDGTYPNHVADPTVEKYMADLKAMLLTSSAKMGVGLDGDCDRMAPMTKEGKLIKGDQLLGLFSDEVLKKYPGSSIVFDVSSSRGLFDLIKKRGGVPVLAPTGVAHIKRHMTEAGAMLGGEMSCHTIFKDRYFGYDDGIYSMLRLFELVHQTEKSLDELLADFPVAFTSPTYRIKCERALCLEIVEKLKTAFSQRSDATLILVDGLRVHFPYGWAIARPSNTEPVFSIRFEGNTAADLEFIKKEFYDLISPYLDFIFD